MNSTIIEKKCSEGFELINGKCVSIETTTTENAVTHQEESVTEVHSPKKTNVCPNGMKSGEHDICEEIQDPNTTEINIELTTDLHENVGEIENIKGCPPGTEADEQGSCQEIKPTNLTAKITNPKALLNDDGSCPDNYKMIEGRCLYIKSKINSTIILSQVKNDLEPKFKHESVPVLPDNSCPEGTEYSEYGLCQKRPHPPASNHQTKSDSSCSIDYELINGKCTPKSSKTQVQLELTTKLPNIIKDSTATQDVSSNEMFSSTTPL